MTIKFVRWYEQRKMFSNKARLTITEEYRNEFGGLIVSSETVVLGNDDIVKLKKILKAFDSRIYLWKELDDSEKVNVTDYTKSKTAD